MSARVEDYASVMLRSEEWHSRHRRSRQWLPRDGTDGEWKIAGRDAILTMKDGITKLATPRARDVPRRTVTSPYFTALPRCGSTTGDEARRPPISVHDCGAGRAVDRPGVQARILSTNEARMPAEWRNQVAVVTGGAAASAEQQRASAASDARIVHAHCGAVVRQEPRCCSADAAGAARHHRHFGLRHSAGIRASLVLKMRACTPGRSTARPARSRAR